VIHNSRLAATGPASNPACYCLQDRELGLPLLVSPTGGSLPTPVFNGTGVSLGYFTLNISTLMIKTNQTVGIELVLVSILINLLIDGLSAKNFIVSRIFICTCTETRLPEGLV
jgi:hypothetical protein